MQAITVVRITKLDRNGEFNRENYIIHRRRKYYDKPLVAGVCIKMQWKMNA